MRTGVALLILAVVFGTGCCGFGVRMGVVGTGCLGRGPGPLTPEEIQNCQGGPVMQLQMDGYRWDQGQQVDQHWSGAGVLLNSNGWVATSNSLVQHALHGEAHAGGGGTFAVTRVLYRDPAADLAIVQIDTSAGGPLPEQVALAPADPAAGDAIFSVGFAADGSLEIGQATAGALQPMTWHGQRVDAFILQGAPTLTASSGVLLDSAGRLVSVRGAGGEAFALSTDYLDRSASGAHDAGTDLATYFAPDPDNVRAHARQESAHEVQVPPGQTAFLIFSVAAGADYLLTASGPVEPAIAVARAESSGDAVIPHPFASGTGRVVFTADADGDIVAAIANPSDRAATFTVSLAVVEW